MAKNCKTCSHWGSTVWHNKYRVCKCPKTLTEVPVMSEAEYGCVHWQKKEAVKRG